MTGMLPEMNLCVRPLAADVWPLFCRPSRGASLGLLSAAINENVPGTRPATRSTTTRPVMNGLVFINVPKFHWTFNVHQLGEFQCHPGTRDGDHQSKVFQSGQNVPGENANPLPPAGTWEHVGGTHQKMCVTG